MPTLEESPEAAQPSLADLYDTAVAVLHDNNRGPYTIPAKNVYTFPWFWDSAFHAIGRRHFDPIGAAEEAAWQLHGQWRNGMIPHMIYEPAHHHALMWASGLVNKSAPNHTWTSGITQPAVMAEAIWKAGEHLPADERRAYWAKHVGQLADYHSWLYRDRSPNDDGLIAAVHPWESGMDSSPAWTEHMRSIDWGASSKLADSLVRRGKNILRHDLKSALHPDERSSLDESALALKALISLWKNRYDGQRLADNHPLHVQDVLMNSVLIRNNELLEKMAHETGRDGELSDELRGNMAKTRGNLERLWDEAAGSYLARDAVTGNFIPVQTAASLLPIYSGAISTARTARLVADLADVSTFGLPYGVPSVPANSPYFNASRYWNGASWTNIEWLLADGAERSGFVRTAAELRARILHQVAKGGIREYFEPYNGRGLGAQDFSWTAAVTIDTINQLEKAA